LRIKEQETCLTLHEHDDDDDDDDDDIYIFSILPFNADCNQFLTNVSNNEGNAEL